MEVIWLTEEEALWSTRKTLDVPHPSQMWVPCPLIAHHRNHLKWSESHLEALLTVLISTIYLRQ